MKVRVFGSTEELSVEQNIESVNPGDVLILQTVMLVVDVDQYADVAQATVVGLHVTGVPTSTIFPEVNYGKAVA